MALAAGTRIGCYDVVTLLGAGGMGEVYRARDTRLKRDVAIKVLPATFSNDPERLARFQREAEVIASLNHPNIAQIYGLEESDNIHALVLELVEGETLAERIARGRIPVDEALPIARQIAEALEAAHEHGIIHRDLKPSNIKLTPDSTVKVLDFGLAKLAASSASGSGIQTAGLSQSPTITSPALITGGGVLLGTAAYMSPEQARGKPVDKRTDIWAFGCVLFEMLTGRRAFDATEVADVLARIIERDPDWRLLSANVPPSLRELLERCLEKDARQRLRDIGEARIHIAAPLSPSRPARWPRVAVAAFISMVAVLLALGAYGVTRPVSHPARPIRFAVMPPEKSFVGQQANPFAVSPDGTSIALLTSSTTGGNGRDLVLRRLDNVEFVTLVSGLNPTSPFFSPDGQWIGFFDNGEIKKVAVSGGTPVTIVGAGRYAGSSRGATWAQDGTIYFATNGIEEGILAVSASGGNVRILTRPKKTTVPEDATTPFALPSGRAVLYSTAVFDRPETSRIDVLDIATGSTRTLIERGFRPAYIKPGWIVYYAGESLNAIRFDPERLTTTGDAFVLTERIDDGHFDLSPAGVLATVVGGTLGLQSSRHLVWVDREGREELVAAPPRAYGARRIRLSPDGTTLAADLADEMRDIWLWSFARRTLTRLTFTSDEEWYPTWDSTGRTLFVASGPPGLHQLARLSADGTGGMEKIGQGELEQLPQSFDAKTNALVIRQQLGVRNDTADLYLISPSTPKAPKPLLITPFSEMMASVSPDGNWIAYDSDQSGRREVYVRRFPDVGSGQWMLSNNGGAGPVWSRSGRELFYIDPNKNLMSVSLADGNPASASAARRLFDASPYFFLTNSVGGTYDVSPDDRRFIMLKEAEQPTSGLVHLQVTLNWVPPVVP